VCACANLLHAALFADTNGDNELDESELEALFQKEVSSSIVDIICRYLMSHLLVDGIVSFQSAFETLHDDLLWFLVCHAVRVQTCDNDDDDDNDDDYLYY